MFNLPAAKAPEESIAGKVNNVCSMTSLLWVWSEPHFSCELNIYMNNKKSLTLCLDD